MDIPRAMDTKILNFMSARSLLSTFLCSSQGATQRMVARVGGRWHIWQRRSRTIFRFEQLLTILEHGFYVRAKQTSTESSTDRCVMTIEVRLEISSPRHSKVDGLSASRN
jgi:hypothetical protein